MHRTYQQVLTEGLPVSNLYFLHGDDDYIIKDVLRRILDKFIGRDFRDFNYQKFSCEKNGCHLDEIIAVSEEIPVLSEKRLVFLEKVDELKSSSLKGLADYMPRTSDKTILVLSYLKSEKGFARASEKAIIGKEFDEVIRKHGISIRCSLSDAEVEHWCRERVSASGYQMKPEVLHLLIQRVGTTLRNLEMEMEKLINYCYEKKVITRKDVEILVRQYPMVKITALTETMGNRDPEGAVKILKELVAEGEYPLSILGYLNSFLKSVFMAKELSEEKTPFNEMAKMMGSPPWMVSKNLKVAGKFSVKELRKIFELLLRADVGIKRGKEPELVLELLILQICRSTRSN